ncbi:MAG: protein kinase [Bacillota bacterium]
MSKPIKGGNCNITINPDNNLAKKTLRNISSKEKVERFRQELELTKTLKTYSLEGVVKIVDVIITDDVKQSAILMEAYNGNLTELLPRSKNNLSFILKLLKPIIESLKILSELENPIYHRDIKPENILYKATDENIKAVLTDFGCAYTKNSDRLTEDHVAVGARLFMSPEAELGKVEEVTAALDIFSIGKLIWWLYNGIENQHLPYNLWYIKEYNLSSNFKDIDSYYANNIIASCTEIQPKDRLSYDSLLLMINEFLSGIQDTKIMEITYLKQKEAQKNIETDQIIAFKNQICNTLYSNMENILTEFVNQFETDFLLNLLNKVKYYKNKLEKNPKSINQLNFMKIFLAIHNGTSLTIALNFKNENRLDFNFKYGNLKATEHICIDNFEDISLKITPQYLKNYFLNIYKLYLSVE